MQKLAVILEKEGARPHADSSLLQLSIEFFCLAITVVQFLFTTLTRLFYKKCNL
jgi:hypothetical protein